MTPKQAWRTVAAAGAALAMAALAAASVARFVRGPAKPFRQRPLSSADLRRVEEMSRELIGLGPEQRQARLRQLLSPNAGPYALDAFAATLERMRQARAWKLAAADGYGPKLVKAVYDITDRGGATEPVGLLFERRDGAIVPLDVAH